MLCPLESILDNAPVELPHLRDEVRLLVCEIVTEVCVLPHVDDDDWEEADWDVAAVLVDEEIDVLLEEHVVS